jgi:hypothetical protein
MAFFSEITLCNLLKVNWYLTGTYHLHFQHETSSACCLLHAGFLLGLFVDPEHGGNMFLQNMSWPSPKYTGLHPRRQNSSFMCNVLDKQQLVSCDVPMKMWTRMLNSEEGPMQGICKQCQLSGSTVAGNFLTINSKQQIVYHGVSSMLASRSSTFKTYQLVNTKMEAIFTSEWNLNPLLLLMFLMWSIWPSFFLEADSAVPRSKIIVVVVVVSAEGFCSLMLI